MTIEPGASLGVLGSGQLGRMFALAARRMGYRVHVLSPERDSPAGQVADREIEAAYEDTAAVAGFARAVEVVTFEFENVPLAAVEAAARFAPVRPAGEVLAVTQDRRREKARLARAGLPVTPFRPASTLEECLRAVQTLSAPCVLKTARGGYDGKGQVLVRSPEEAPGAWHSLATGDAIVESFVDLEREFSVVAARGADGEVALYGPIDNVHVRHILDLSTAPTALEPAIARRAGEIAVAVVETLEVIGVLCVEMFLSRAGELLVNELAPRPHNSGHLTVDAHRSSQFEQQVRAICALPLGSAEQLRPAAMANLLGDLWQDAAPLWARALADPDVKLHLYGKGEPRPGRKMGHLTVLAASAAAAARRALAARSALAGPRDRQTRRAFSD